MNETSVPIRMGVFEAIAYSMRKDPKKTRLDYMLRHKMVEVKPKAADILVSTIPILGCFTLGLLQILTAK